MLRLCLAQVDRSDPAQADREAGLELPRFRWLGRDGLWGVSAHCRNRTHSSSVIVRASGPQLQHFRMRRESSREVST